ncbi:MAG: acyl-CoA dehydrogenase family protein [Pseudomonadota bacterium]
MSELTEYQRIIKDQIKKVLEKRLTPIVATLDEEERELPFEIWDLFQEMGLLTHVIPARYGGTEDSSLTTLCIILEEVSKVCLSSGLSCLSSALLQLAILKGGTEGQREHYFQRILKRRTILAICVTEPGCGSDAAAIKTKAEKIGSKYKINGTKTFITNGSIADLYFTWAVTDTRKKARGISCFIVERGTPGLRVGKKEKKMGLRASPTTEVIYDDALIPGEDLLGCIEGTGFKVLMEIFDITRIAMGALAVGLSQAAIDFAINYCKIRVSFGKPLIEHQGMAFLLAEMSTLNEAARALVYNTREQYDRGENMIKLASMVKYFTAQSTMRITTDAVQCLGGYGYVRDFPVERYMRDAKILEIFEGTSQIQKLIIAREL